jgi:hypothetical protein
VICPMAEPRVSYRQASVDYFSCDHAYGLICRIAEDESTSELVWPGQ